MLTHLLYNKLFFASKRGGCNSVKTFTLVAWIEDSAVEVQLILPFIYDKISLFFCQPLITHAIMCLQTIFFIKNIQKYIFHSLFTLTVWIFVSPWTEPCQASLSINSSQSLLKLMSIESVMPSNHLIQLSKEASPSLVWKPLDLNLYFPESVKITQAWNVLKTIKILVEMVIYFSM